MENYIYKIRRKLNPLEAESLFYELFGTTEVGVISIEDIKDNIYYCPICDDVLDITEIDSCMNTPNEIIDYCQKCGGEVFDLKEYFKGDNRDYELKGMSLKKIKEKYK
jgi:hypothetical protein